MECETQCRRRFTSCPFFLDPKHPLSTSSSCFLKAARLIPGTEDQVSLYPYSLDVEFDVNLFDFGRRIDLRRGTMTTRKAGGRTKRWRTGTREG